MELIGAEICGIVLMLMVLYAAFAYMAAQFFRRPEWEDKSKEELYQVFVSAAIIVVAFGVALAADEISKAYAGGDAFTVAEDYMQNVMYGWLFPQFFTLNQLAYLSQYFEGVYGRVGPTVWSFMFQMAPGAGAIDKLCQFLINILSMLYASMVVQLVALQFAKSLAFPLLLPAGMVMRAFAPTREAGSFMIVSAVAFQVIFPATYVVHTEVMKIVRQQDTDTHWFERWWDDVTNPNGTNPLKTSAFLAYFTSSYVDIRLLFAVFDNLGYSTMLAFFPGTLSIIITMTFIKSMTKFVAQKLD